ncbi:hypothetical protein I302_106051 [Kwoniella bestiolae CBS 10118]|uniref:DUF7729 domain-containing protein n=1 Tax=Kwoniella bestiolae CBS 10118 TaxID=1296100 RepID=A0A1B9G2V5_9TREE|nr:hypothetical protein I302_05176 [Kwoniella bestiolae CBS 10118]OCF25357.1 hypothetical protein I302_05176 [Kwoniella bestiolae CBS 10118]
MKTHFVLSLVLGLMMSSASAHGHGIRSRYRSNDPAKRVYVEKEEVVIPIISPTESGSGSSSVNTNSTSTSKQNLYTRTNSSSSSSLPKPPSTPPTTLTKPIPKPLDLSISPSALSTGCLTYLTSLLSSSDFQDCLPFSLLLSTSSSYSSMVSSAKSTENYDKLNNLISYTSSSAMDQCDSYFTSISSSLASNKNCGTDLQNKNQVVKDTKVAIGNYKLLKDLSGLVDEDTGVYCYLQGVRGERPDDAYLWSLGGGIPLPSKSIPTCSKCSKYILNTYMSYVPDTPTLNGTIVKSAINRVNEACGQGFVNLSTIAVTSSAMSSVERSVMGGWVVGIVVSLLCLVLLP